jgi:exonuclease SbcC
LGAVGGDGDTVEPPPPDPLADGEPPADQEALDGLRLRIETLLTACNASLVEAGERLEAARRDKAACDDLAARWDRRTEALHRLEERESRQEVVNDYRQRLRRAEQAESLRASLADEQRAREQLAALDAAVREQLRRMFQVRAAATALPDSVQALDLSTLPDAGALALAGNDLAAWRVEVTALLRKAAEAAQCRRGAQQAAQRAREAGDRLTRAQATRQRLQGERKAALETVQLARSARDQTEGLQLAARQAALIADAAEAIAPAQSQVAACHADQKRSETASAQASEVLRELQRRQIEGMATRLAGALQPGNACPVCGSREHPRPAEGGSPESLDQALAEAERRLQAAQARSRTALSALTRADSQLQALTEQAGSAGEDPRAARHQANTAMATLQAAQKAAASLEQLEGMIQAGDRQNDQLQAELQAAATDQAVQAATAEQENRRAETLEQEITTALGGGVDPRMVLDGIASLDPLLKELQKSGEASGHGRILLEQASERLGRELAATPFEDGQAVRDALQQEDTRRRWADRIQAYERELLELRGLLASPDLADLPEARPDTTAAQAAIARADGLRTQALTRQAQVERGHRETARLCDEHRGGSDALERQRATAQLLNAVADRCQGRTAPFISLQRWVLSAYLGEICGHANRRLEQMTAGRYQLQLSDGGGRGGRQAGLALRVLDAYTGEEREVNSLSGGETFQASLALALGVAETVEGHAGGLHLEALFIDEGFGTLDPDTLQLAMDELDRLREGGRMIGIISHVGALRERIRSGIEVLAGEQGSSLRVGRLHQL